MRVFCVWCQTFQSSRELLHGRRRIFLRATLLLAYLRMRLQKSIGDVFDVSTGSFYRVASFHRNIPGLLEIVSSSRPLLSPMVVPLRLRRREQPMQNRSFCQQILQQNQSRTGMAERRIGVVKLVALKLYAQAQRQGMRTSQDECVYEA